MLSVRASRQFVLLKRTVIPATASGFSTSSQRFSAVKNVTVIGSGLMGSGIAQVAFISCRRTLNKNLFIITEFCGQ